MVQMFLLMLLQTAMLAFSQVALKLAMEGMHWEWSWSFIWHNVILNGWLMLAVTLMIGANLFWLWMLHKYPLSQVYPLTSLGFVFSVIAGMIVFHEHVAPIHWIGVLLIMAGCICIARVV